LTPSGIFILIRNLPIQAQAPYLLAASARFHIIIKALALRML